ncbi:MAG: hypothetical protein CHACPFDD_03379 [Phycisphaerae bacterium]|nr:hypothetical protein [Phycisphaerae bacterium]
MALSIESIDFKNFRVLRDTTLPLGPFTLLVGPNGAGKSTAVDGILALAGKVSRALSGSASVGAPKRGIEISCRLSDSNVVRRVWETGSEKGAWVDPQASRGQLSPNVQEFFSRIRAFTFEAQVLKQPSGVEPSPELGERGEKLASVIDNLKDLHPENFESFVAEVRRWLPEYDYVQLVPKQNAKSVALRTVSGKHQIAAEDLSHGTLIALALLLLSHLPEPPPLVCLEEPDRGLHPRLLRDVRDAIFRLCHPESVGAARPAVQVLATTHSPYFLDLFREYPECVVIADKHDLEARFTRLIDRPDIDEILQQAPLGDAWYTGVLGGVPSRP